MELSKFLNFGFESVRIYGRNFDPIQFPTCFQ